MVKNKQSFLIAGVKMLIIDPLTNIVLSKDEGGAIQ